MKRASQKQVVTFLKTLPQDVLYTSRTEYVSPGWIERIYNPAKECILILDLHSRFPKCQAFIKE